jgi:hypothetical protein
MYLECRHILTSGNKCRAAALRGKAYCYFHFNAHLQRHTAKNSRYLSYTPDLQIPLLEDPSAIQLAISEVVQAIAQNRMDPKRAGRLLYGLQLASINVKKAKKIIAKHPVRELCWNPEAEPIGPPVAVYEEGDQVPEEGADGPNKQVFEEAHKNIDRNIDGAPGTEMNSAEINSEQDDSADAAPHPEAASDSAVHGHGASSVERLAACLDDNDPDILRQTIQDFVRDLRVGHPNLRR